MTGFAQTPPSYIPVGWRIPQPSDFKENGGWSYYLQGQGYLPYYAAADFNSDGVVDVAWLLINDIKKEYGLFVFINKSGSYVKALEKLGCVDCQLWDAAGKKNPKYDMVGRVDRAIVHLANSKNMICFGVFESSSICYSWDRTKQAFVQQY